MIVDLHWEEPSLSGPPKVSGFRQCIMEDMLEEVALGAGVSLHRGYGECLIASARERG